MTYFLWPKSWCFEKSDPQLVLNLARKLISLPWCYPIGQKGPNVTYDWLLCSASSMVASDWLWYFAWPSGVFLLVRIYCKLYSDWLLFFAWPSGVFLLVRIYCKLCYDRTSSWAVLSYWSVYTVLQAVFWLDKQLSGALLLVRYVVSRVLIGCGVC